MDQVIKENTAIPLGISILSFSLSLSLSILSLSLFWSLSLSHSHFGRSYLGVARPWTPKPEKWPRVRLSHKESDQRLSPSRSPHLSPSLSLSLFTLPQSGLLNRALIGPTWQRTKIFVMSRMSLRSIPLEPALLCTPSDLFKPDGSDSERPQFSLQLSLSQLLDRNSTATLNNEG